MKNGKLLAKAVSTQLFSWGSDMPAECYWFVNELIEFVNAETGSNLVDLEGEEYTDENSDKVDAIIDWLESDECNKTDETHKE
jgi:hypothetical protein